MSGATLFVGEDSNLETRPKKRTWSSCQTGSVRSRNTTACERCRRKKTKCDNSQPRCGHCANASIDCVYPDDLISSPCQEAIREVHKAIEELTSVVKSQQHGCFTHAAQSTFETRPEMRSAGLFSAPTVVATSVNHQANVIAIDHGTSLENSCIRTQGTSTILSWPVFTNIQLPPLSVENADNGCTLSSNVPSFARSQITRLVNQYINGVHMMNPIVDLVDVEDIINQITETGPEWTNKTCLLALICALGAVNQLYQPGYNSETGGVSPVTAHCHIDGVDNKQLSLQYWSLAVKRLGISIAHNDVESVQCLCLAGILCMHYLQPLQAWKYFNLAGAAWYAVNMTKGSDFQVFERFGQLGSFTLMQSLYFTIWKSDCELKLELDVPGPILDEVKFPHAFPLPPASDIGTPENQIVENERIWLYYLADIAARHLLNRLLKTLQFLPREGGVSNQDIRNMLVHADEMEIQLNDWYLSLPTIHEFVIPETYSLQPHPHDLTQILRHRYLSFRELISRPFLKLCIETPLQVDHHLRRRVIDFASQNVRFCMLRLTQAAPHIHQGTWFGMRNLASSALLLYALWLARQGSWAHASHDILFPGDWRERILHAYEAYTLVLATREGGAPDIVRVLERILADTAHMEPIE